MRKSTIAAAGLLALAAIGLPLCVWAQSGKQQGNKTAPPPKWTQSTLRLFFADATQEVGPGQPGGARPGSNGLAGGDGTMPAGGGAGASDGQSWSKLVDAETLESEIKININSLATAVENPNKFKAQHFRRARNNFTQLAMLFGVIAGYDGDVKWKDKAAGMRDAVAKAGFNCKVGTDASYTEAKARFEDLRQLLQGSSPQVPDAEASADWVKVADRGELMKRMEEAGQKRITPWTGSEGEFKANQADLLHEAQLLAVMARVISHSSYDYADDDNYLKYAKALEQASTELIDGAKQANFEKARAATGNMAKACANCHTDFR